MTFDYSKSATLARKLLTKFGRTIQHQKVTEGTYDPNTGTVTNTTLNTNVVAADFDVDANTYNKSGLIQAGDRYAILASNILLIDVSDKLIIDTVEWTIIKVERLAPANFTVLWKCFIRK